MNARSVRLLLGALALALSPNAVGAATIQIVDGDEAFIPFGDFAAVAGTTAASSPGQVVEVLGGTSAPTLRRDGSESASNTLAMSVLWNTLSAGGVSSADSLVFGFGINETGPVGSNWVVLTDLLISFERTGGASQSFSLGNDAVQVFNYEQGQNTAEVQFEVALGFDFMAEYSSASTEDFFIHAAVDNTSDGFEVFFLSSGFTLNPPTVIAPEPGTFALVGLGLAGLAGLRTRRASRRS
ncbi:MAG: PEP-CTERM sorting domain-containing protein [Myxococcota bacterium]